MKLDCPHCGVHGSIDDSLAAKKLRCPKCSKVFLIPPDMLPGDVTGVSVYNQKTSDFEYRPGPVMSNIILADEINRAPAKVQSALLKPCRKDKSLSGMEPIHWKNLFL